MYKVIAPPAVPAVLPINIDKHVAVEWTENTLLPTVEVYDSTYCGYTHEVSVFAIYQDRIEKIRSWGVDTAIRRERVAKKFATDCPNAVMLAVVIRTKTTYYQGGQNEVYTSCTWYEKKD